jgi:hypothetical protein
MSLRGALVVLLAAFPACSSWDTGSGTGDDAEQACNATLEAYARAAERCGEDYKTAYDTLLQANAAGDCKNVRSIRDERALRETCIPFVLALSCEEQANGKTDPSCARQLQRTAGFTPSLTTLTTLTSKER